MIIKEVRTRHIRAPWVEPPVFGAVVPEHRDVLVAEIETDSGIVGMGYLILLRGGVPTVRACLEELVIPEIIGRDATDIEGIWQDLWKANYWIGRMGVTVLAQSVIDIALWDALGKRTGLPLHRLWGHCADAIPAYGSGCWRGYGPEGMVERAERYVEQGFKSIKMQCGRGTARAMKLLKHFLLIWQVVRPAKSFATLATGRPKTLLCLISDPFG